MFSTSQDQRVEWIPFKTAFLNKPHHFFLSPLLSSSFHPIFFRCRWGVPRPALFTPSLIEKGDCLFLPWSWNFKGRLGKERGWWHRRPEALKKGPGLKYAVLVHLKAVAVVTSDMNLDTIGCGHTSCTCSIEFWPIDLPDFGAVKTEIHSGA